MPFTDQRERLRRTVRNAIDGCAYVSSSEDAGERMLTLEARRPDGRIVHLRFRGVRDSEASEAPATGGALRFVSVGAASRLGLIGLFLPGPRLPGEDYSRVRIDAGAARLDIVCQDAEWWEDEGGPETT